MAHDLGQNLLTTLSAIWCDVLQRNEIGPDDDFIALGGDSLLAMEMTFRVHEAFGLGSPDEIILGIDKGATLTELSHFVAEQAMRHPGP